MDHASFSFTLKQKETICKEGNKLLFLFVFQRKIELKADDTESRSSENSDGGVRRRRPAPLPPNQHSRQKIGSIPDVAAVSQSDLSLSRFSRVSTGSSGGSSQDVRPDSVFNQVTSPPYSIHPNNTSTPAKPMNQSYRGKSFDDINNSAFSRVQGPDANDSYNSPQYKSSRDSGNRLTPDARLDILTRGNNSAFSPTSSTSGRPPLSNHSSPNDQRSRPNDSDMSIQSGQSQPSPQSAGSTNQRPVRATHPHYPRSHSPGRGSQQQQYNEHSPRTQQSPPRKSNILVSRANVGPQVQHRPNNISRARPASAFGAPVHNTSQGESQLNSSFQSPMNSVRPSRLDLNNSQMSNQSISDIRKSFDGSYSNSPSGHPHSNGPMNNVAPRGRQMPMMGRSERPKSVPPTMFNAQLGGSDSDSNYNNENYNQSNHVGRDNMSNHTGVGKGTPPVPPPRKTSRYNVFREPTSPTRTGYGERGLPTSPSGMSAPVEQKEPGKKEIWYEYGCV